MKKSIGRVFLVALSVATVFSCTKKDPPDPGPDPSGLSQVKLEFENMVGSSKLSLNNQWYINEHGDSFKVSKFNYYISNVVLNGAKAYAEHESYHLVQQELASSASFNLSAVPWGQYTSVTLTIGVDSLHNVSGAQTGALDPINDMFWTWSTGYIMLKLEGKSTKSPLADSAIRFHAGGYSGPYATQRTVTLNFPTPITVSKDGVNHVHIAADVLKLFKSPTVFNFATLYAVNTSGANAKVFADNYANMLSVTYSGL